MIVGRGMTERHREINRGEATECVPYWCLFLTAAWEQSNNHHSNIAALISPNCYNRIRTKDVSKSI